MDVIPGRAIRGNVYQRRSRRLWLLATFGDGKTTPCFWCGTTLTYQTLEVDRYPLCSHDGGRYLRSNIVPACIRCNHGRCNPCSSERPRCRPDWWSREGREGVSLRKALQRGVKRS